MNSVNIQAQNYIETVFFNAPVGMALFDAHDFRLFKANNAFLSIVDEFVEPHWRHGKIINHCLATWGNSAEWGIEFSNILDLFRQVATTGQPRSGIESTTATVQQDAIYWNWSLTPVKDANDNTTHIIHIISNVTDQVRARQKAEQAQLEFNLSHKLVEAERSRLEVIEAVSRSVRTSLDAGSIGTIAITAIRDHFHTDCTYIHIADPVQKVLHLLCAHVPASHENLKKTLRTVPYEQLLSQIHYPEQKDPIIIEDLQAAHASGIITEDNLLSHLSKYGFVCIPLWFGDHFEGTLTVTFDHPIKADDPDISILIGCSTHIAAALTHARILDDKERERNRLRSVLDQLPEGILIAEVSDGTISYANSAAAETLGLSQEALTHTPFYRHPSAQQTEGQRIPPWHFIVIRALCGETIKGKETLVVRPDGRQVITLTSSAPLYTDQGTMTGAVIVFQDVTEKKTLEQHKNEFLSIINHELRTPITIIQGFAEILQLKIAQENPLDTLSQYAIASINEQSQHLTQLIEEMLDLSRIEQAEFKLNRSRHDLMEILNKVISSQSIITRHHTIRLEPEGIPPTGQLFLWIDEKRITQMLSNLINNAIKYSPEGGDIEIGVRITSDRPHEVLLWVKDQGIGIAPNELPLIFQRFHRVPNVDISISGFGIGLYLVKEVVTHHGGRIWVESTEGIGSTFYVSLPLPTQKQLQ